MKIDFDKVDAELKSKPKTFGADGESKIRNILIKNDPILLLEHPDNEKYLYIKTKTGALVNFTLNKAQIHILNIIKKIIKAEKAIRLIVLKARQVGSTTLFMSLIYAMTSQKENQGAAVIADEKSKANDIFEMAKLFHEKTPDPIKPKIKKSNERKLEFADIHSHIMIDTAENKDAGRSSTLRHVLLSEYAYYRKNYADALMLGISHSVPSLPETMIIKETTANGYNHFKDEWDSSVAGENDYVPIFVPWYWDEGYRMHVDDKFILGDSSLGDITQDEPALAKQMVNEDIININERLAWRRWDIRNNCKGDIELFKQENPSTPEEAFLASGQCFFNQKRLVKMLNNAKPPLFRANIVKENFKWILRKCDEGDFMFFEDPYSYGQYCIGGDACSGSGTDFACLIARNKDSNKITAAFHAKCDPDELAYRAMCLGSYLNNAKVAIENDKFGFAANRKLITIYGNVYVKRSYDKTSNKTTETFGWDTNILTRSMMLAQMQEEIREGSLQLNYAGTVKEPGLIRECLSFIKNPDTRKAEAEAGKNDDTVIACAISGQIRNDEPVPKSIDREIRKAKEYEALEIRNAGLAFGAKR